MAKTSTKTKTSVESAAPKAKKATPSKGPVKKSSLTIEDACEAALTKLRELDIEHGLQADLQWCLGSYRADGNPIGLFQMLDRSIAVFEREKTTKTAGVTAKLISDLSKALKA